MHKPPTAAEFVASRYPMDAAGPDKTRCWNGAEFDTLEVLLATADPSFGQASKENQQIVGRHAEGGRVVAEFGTAADVIASATRKVATARVEASGNGDIAPAHPRPASPPAA